MASWEIGYELDIGYYIWKIPSVSSIPHVVGFVFQSPSFSFGGTYWTLKMYPNGDSRENDGFTSLSIERLETRGNVFCKFYCKNYFNNEICLIDDYYIDPKKENSIPRLMNNLKEISQDSDIVTNDTLYLVIELQTKSGFFPPTISSTETVGTTDGNESVVGEIFKEYEGGKYLYFLVSDILRVYFPVPSDYFIKSPQFSFFNANWILKVRPYHRMESSEKASFDIVLERLESQVPVHHVRVLIHLFLSEVAKEEKYCIFDSRRIQSPAFEFQLKELYETNLDFDIEIRQFKSARICLEPEKKSAEKSTVDVQKPGPSGSSTESTVCLKCKALQDYKKMFFAKEDCDVTFKVKGQELLAHRNILKFRSPVLASALSIEMKEKITGVMEIEDCELSHFADFLQFIYCGEVENLTTENMFSLFTVADKYQVLELKNVCRDFIKRNLTIETFCETITLALLHCETDLIELCTEFFAKNMKDIIVTLKWQSFILENPIRGNELLIKALKINSNEQR